MWRHYVYIHFKASDHVPFYVGKGSHSAHIKAQTFGRAFEVHFNRHWHNVVNKHGIIVNIIASCKTDLEAQRLEKLIIANIGRYDLGKGPLVNLTDGGDGHSGLILSNSARAKRSLNAKRKRSDAWIASIRAARKNGGNGGVVKLGDKLPQIWRDNIAKTKVGSKNPHYGKTTKIARKVINKATNETYISVTEAAKNNNLNMKSLYNMLSGHRHNHTALRFV